ncbi:putative bifunctional inhibitor/plant lipid transfer protein/seed storage helical domain superfamily [Helianthus anomalus]
MAKLATFAFILIAIVAFSKMSAYRTTTIEDNGNEMQIEISMIKQCQCGVIQQTHDKAQQKAADKFEKKLLHDAAQSLPNDCKLSLKDCRIAGPKD